MSHGTLPIVILTTLLAFGAPASAKENKQPAKQTARTWKTLVDYALTNGTDRTLKAPLTRNLGFESDAIATKALRYKAADAPDKKIHAIYVLSAQDKQGKPISIGIVLGNGFAVNKDGVKNVEDFFVRTDLNGTILAAIRSRGPAGHVEETRLEPNSPEAVSGFKAEQSLLLEAMDLRKLSK